MCKFKRKSGIRSFAQLGKNWGKVVSVLTVPHLDLKWRALTKPQPAICTPHTMKWRTAKEEKGKAIWQGEQGAWWQRNDRGSFQGPSIHLESPHVQYWDTLRRANWGHHSPYSWAAFILQASRSWESMSFIINYITENETSWVVPTPLCLDLLPV